MKRHTIATAMTSIQMRVQSSPERLAASTSVSSNGSMASKSTMQVQAAIAAPWRMTKTSTAIGSLLSHLVVRAGSSLDPVGEVGTPPLSNGPFLRHQQTSVSRRRVEDLIDVVTAQVDPIDAVGKFPNQSHSHV